MGYSRLRCKRDGRSLFLTWSGSFVPALRLDMFQPCGARFRWCLYLSPVGIPTVDLGILDLSVSHRPYSSGSSHFNPTNMYTRLESLWKRLFFSQCQLQIHSLVTKKKQTYYTTYGTSCNMVQSKRWWVGLFFRMGEKGNATKYWGVNYWKAFSENMDKYTKDNIKYNENSNMLG
jgi:hypothetical protein